MTQCPGCGHAGRAVSETTVMSLLGPSALERRERRRHRFCPTQTCPVVYFGGGEVMHRDDLQVPVFCKEPAGNRLVCYCFGIREPDITASRQPGRHSAIFHRVRTLVREGRCACEVKNPHGSCCLNEIVQIERSRPGKETRLSPVVRRLTVSRLR